MSRGDFRFTHRFRVRYAEVDAQAVVFNSRYLEYADVLHNEFLRGRGISIVGADAFEVHVRKTTVDYLKPILLDEEIDGLVRVSRIGNSSMTVLIELHGVDREDLRATIEIVYIHVDLETGSPTVIPDAVRLAISN